MASLHICLWLLVVGVFYRIGEFAKRVGRSVRAGRHEPGGGMDLRREEFLALMDAVDQAEVATLVMAHKDRLARFGFDLLEHVAARGGREIVVAGPKALSPRQDLVENLLAVVRAFSCRLDGLRRHVKELQGADLAVEGVR